MIPNKSGRLLVTVIEAESGRGGGWVGGGGGHSGGGSGGGGGGGGGWGVSSPPNNDIGGAQPLLTKRQYNCYSLPARWLAYIQL